MKRYGKASSQMFPGIEKLWLNGNLSIIEKIQTPRNDEK